MNDEGNRKGKIALNIFVFVFILLINTVVIMSKTVSNLDEIWNYNMANQIARGLVPYREISMIMTPFSQLLLAPFLLIFNGVLTYRIAGIILSTLMSFIAYDIVKKITENRMIGFIFVIIGEFFLYKLFTYDYNFLCVLLGEIALDLEVTKYLKKRQNFEDMINYGSIYRKAEKKTFSERHQYINFDIAIGIIAGLTICTKQTVGALLALTVLVLAILDRKLVIVSKDNTNKKKSKKNKEQKEEELNTSEDELYINTRENNEFRRRKINSILARVISIVSPCLILLFYLLFTKSIKDFISYTIIGIKEFTNSISYWHLIEEGGNLLISILAVLLPAYLVLGLLFLIWGDKDRTINNVFKILLLYSIPFLLLIYPIADKMHFCLGTFILLISVPFAIKFSIRDLLSHISESRRESINNALAITIFIIFIILLGKSVGESVSELYSHRGKGSEINHLEHLYVDDYLKNRIKDTNEKIEELRSTGAEVYILDSESALYNIVKDEYYKDYDMFNCGNFGENGEERILQNIKESHNTYYLVRNSEIALNWQTPKSIVNEIRTYDDKGKIGLFEIYFKE